MVVSWGFIYSRRRCEYWFEDHRSFISEFPYLIIDIKGSFFPLTHHCLNWVKWWFLELSIPSALDVCTRLDLLPWPHITWTDITQGLYTTVAELSHPTVPCHKLTTAISLSYWYLAPWPLGYQGCHTSRGQIQITVSHRHIKYWVKGS